VSLLALTIQMYQICTPKVPRILNPTYHLTLSQTETYILCVDLIIIIVKKNCNNDESTMNVERLFEIAVPIALCLFTLITINV
jgi:hypothetical protein